MTLPPLPRELVNADEDRAPPGFGLVLALAMSVPIWAIVLFVAFWWH